MQTALSAGAAFEPRGRIQISRGFANLLGSIMLRSIKNIASAIFKENPPAFTDPLARLSFSIFRKLQGPQAIEWFPSYVCNSRCQYCGGYDKEAKAGFGKIVPTKNITEWIKSSGSSGSTLWNIGGRGGEPLLYPKLIEALELIKFYKMQGVLITNGILLDEAFLSRLAKAKWDILRISLDSHIPEIHDQIRGIEGNFRNIDKALNLLKKIKEDSSSAYPYIICCPVITSKNYKHIPGYIEYCIKQGVEEIQFMPLINVHQRAAQLSLSDEQKNELMVFLQASVGEKRIRHNIGFIISLFKDNKNTDPGIPVVSNSPKKLYCIHLWKTLVISEDGFLSPCSLIKDKLLKINGSYTGAWNSREMNNLRQKILRGELISPLCNDCCGPLRNETDNFNRYLREVSH
jgi:MoaA/NifB/PqqE/SkfB family radical SAM enzyme